MGGALLAAAAVGAILYGSAGSDAGVQRGTGQGRIETLVAATARQLRADGTSGISAEGRRLVYRIAVARPIGAADASALRVRDAASLCAGVDTSRLIGLGAIIERRYTDVRGRSFTSAVATCPGGGAAARAQMPVAM